MMKMKLSNNYLTKFKKKDKNFKFSQPKNFNFFWTGLSIITKSNSLIKIKKILILKITLNRKFRKCKEKFNSYSHMLVFQMEKTCQKNSTNILSSQISSKNLNIHKLEILDIIVNLLVSIQDILRFQNQKKKL